MQVKIDRGRLLACLQRVKNVASGKNTSMHILGCVLVEAKEGELIINGTDLSTSMQVKTECMVKEPGACVVHARGLLDIAKSLPDGEITMEVPQGGEMLHISMVGYRFRLNALPVEEFPEISLPKWIEGDVVIVSEAIRYMIENTFFVIARGGISEYRYDLDGAHLMMVKDGDTSYLEMATSDAKRLAVARRAVDEDVIPGEIIVPRSGLKELGKLIDAHEESTVYFSGDSLYFVSEDTTASVRMISGTFPKYESVIKPEDYPIVVTTDASELLNALNVCAALLSGDTYYKTKFTFSRTTITLYADDPVRGDVEVVVSSELEGDGLEVSFNPWYFIDCLSLVDEEVEIRLKDKDGPCLVMPKGDMDRRWVIMPMRE